MSAKPMPEMAKVMAQPERKLCRVSPSSRLVGGWRLAVGGWRLAVGGWRLAVGGWRLAVGGWRLAVGGWRLAVGGWRLAVGGWRSAVGGRRLAVGGWRFIPESSGKRRISGVFTMPRSDPLSALKKQSFEKGLIPDKN